MTSAVSRRSFVAGFAAAGSGLASAPVFALEGEAPFDFGALVDLARERASRPHEAQVQSPLGVSIDYDAIRRLRYRPERALWADTNGAFRAMMFHLGWLYVNPVEVSEIVGRRARPVPYDPSAFEFDDPAVEAAAVAGAADLGYAGVRLNAPFNRPDRFDEVISFLGASYFRALGRGNVYGLSARGLAIDTGSKSGEEFPAFTRFWLERPAPEAGSVRLWALLESDRVTGAYGFHVTPGARTRVRVQARLFVRREIELLGVAPVTSMYAFGANDRVGVDDFRPAVHDSDGLSMLSGAGEWLWRPLENPQTLRMSSFLDTRPGGYGLLQRERAFTAYQDSEARYELRPSAWVEPHGDWGRGAVRLIEIPTPNESNDNIIAMWAPEGGVRAGEELGLEYTLHWGMKPPIESPAASAISTRSGHAGIAGAEPNPNARKFVVDFAGGAIDALPDDVALEPVLSVKAGEASNVIVVRRADRAAWRVKFDVRRAGREPVEMRCFLRFGASTLTETWTAQWTD